MLHRRRALLLGALLLALASAGPAARKERGPRALAVLEWVNGKARLAPVSIYYNNRFYDAGVYKASPVPMALEPGTVYEVAQQGVSEGLFTISHAVQSKRAWFGEGRWQPSKPSPETAQPKLKPVPKAAMPDEDAPPVLRRPGSSAAEKREEPKPAPGKETAAQPPSAPAPPASPEVEEDPNRPVLRRGKPAKAQGEEAPPPPLKGAGAGKAAGSAALVAISDAVAQDLRPFTFEMRPQELERYRRELTVMAGAEILRYANARPGPKPQTAASPPKSAAVPPRRGAAQTSVAPEPKLTGTQVHVFDLTLYNEPMLVFTAAAPAAGDPLSGKAFEFYITLAARLESDGGLRKLFAGVTDTAHLDARPRLELIDAVDADGDNRGELLFRQVWEVGRSYVIYRVTRDTLVELFEGGAE
jgi:hypothetical protein